MRAADRLVDDLVDHAQRLEPVRGNAQRFGSFLRLVRRFPENRGAAFGADDGVNRVLQHHQLVSHRNGQCAARAAFANDGGNDGHFELRHFKNIAANGFRLAALFSFDARISARRIDKREHRQLEFFSRLHQAQRLAVAFGLAHAEVAQPAFLGVAPFLVAQHHTGVAIEARQAAHNAQVVSKMPVAVQLDKVGKDVPNVVQRVRPFGVPGNLGDLPGRQNAVDVFGELLAFFGQLLDFFRNIDR